MIPESARRKVHRLPLSADVELALREAIVGGHLKPGDRIIEGEIADQFHVSRGPVREALSQLEQDGLVSRRRHRGTFVKTLSRRDVTETYTLLALLEGEAGALALEHITDRDILGLAGLVEQFWRALAANDVYQMLEADRAFHSIVIRASAHRLLEQAWRRLDGIKAACFLAITTTIPELMWSIAERHQHLIEVLREGNAEKVRHAFLEHYLDSLPQMARVLESHDEPTDKLRAV